jgi:H+/Cl- antiporter ClcA
VSPANNHRGWLVLFIPAIGGLIVGLMARYGSIPEAMEQVLLNESRIPAAVLLAIELLLFEFRPRSIIPVALASVTATAVRMLYVGTDPIFAMPLLARPTGEAYAAYAIVGAIVGWLAVYANAAANIATAVTPTVTCVSLELGWPCMMTGSRDTIKIPTRRKGARTPLMIAHQ